MATGKIYSSCDEAVADVPDGATIMIGGWGSPVGDSPQNLILALRKQGAKGLTIISNNAGHPRRVAEKIFGVSEIVDNEMLIANGQIKKFICTISFSGSLLEKGVLAKEIEAEFVPQGTLAERIRAGGFGIGGFYTPTGIGTIVAEGKEERVINGKKYILELPLRADYALIRAYKADKLGNLIYRGTMRSFNSVMAPAVDVTIVEADNIVDIGELDPDAIVTPQLFVDRIVEVPKEKK
jgi:3-oxoacid CoA-transferase subunit A